MLYNNNNIRRVKLVKLDEELDSEKSESEHIVSGVAACSVHTACMAGSANDKCCKMSAGVCTPKIANHDDQLQIKMLKFYDNGTAAFMGENLVKFIHGYGKASTIKHAMLSVQNENVK